MLYLQIIHYRWQTPTVWKNFDGCTILITLSPSEVEHHNGYMNFCEPIGVNREWLLDQDEKTFFIFQFRLRIDVVCRSYLCC